MRWIGRDKIVLTTQYNLYTLINNGTIHHIDRLGLYVVLCFAYKEGTITGFKQMNNSKKIEILDPIIENVFSGNTDEETKVDHYNNRNSQHVIGHGPIPIGEYWIGHEYIPKSHIEDAQRGKNYKWHRLYGDDGKGGKSYTHIPVWNPETKKYVYRGAFNLHTGCESDGCVTVESEIEDSNSPLYPKSDAYDKLNNFINDAKTLPLRNPRNQNDTYLGILLVEECQKDCVKSLKAYQKKLLSLLMLFFFFMSSMVQAATVVDTNSQAIQTALSIEKIAKSSPGLSQEKKYAKEIESVIDKVNDEQILFTLAILFHEGYPSFCESPEDRLMFFAQEYIVIKLAKMGTEKAYHYFRILKKLYGRDGADYRGYRLLEYRYLKQYSEDAEVKNASSEDRWK